MPPVFSNSYHRSHNFSKKPFGFSYRTRVTAPRPTNAEVRDRPSSPIHSDSSAFILNPPNAAKRSLDFTSEYIPTDQIQGSLTQGSFHSAPEFQTTFNPPTKRLCHSEPDQTDLISAGPSLAPPLYSPVPSHSEPGYLSPEHLEVSSFSPVPGSLSQPEFDENIMDAQDLEPAYAPNGSQEIYYDDFDPAELTAPPLSALNPYQTQFQTPHSAPSSSGFIPDHQPLNPTYGTSVYPAYEQPGSNDLAVDSDDELHHFFLLPPDARLAYSPHRIKFRQHVFTSTDLEIEQGQQSGLPVTICRPHPGAPLSEPLASFLAECTRFSPSAKPPSRFSSFLSSTKVFAANSLLAERLHCQADPDSAVLRLSQLSPALASFIKEPLKKPKTLPSAWEFKGTSSSADATFGFLSSPKRDPLPLLNLETSAGAFTSLSGENIKRDSNLRSTAKELISVHEALFLLTQSLSAASQFSSGTSLSQVKRHLSHLSEFAESARRRLETPALSSLHSAVLFAESLRLSAIKGMVPPPVTSVLRSSPIIHNESYVFPSDALKAADLAASQHFRDFRPAQGSAAEKSKFRNRGRTPSKTSSAKQGTGRSASQPSFHPPPSQFPTFQIPFHVPPHASHTGRGTYRGTRPQTFQPTQPSAAYHNFQAAPSYQTARPTTSQQRGKRGTSQRGRGTASGTSGQQRGRSTNYSRGNRGSGRGYAASAPSQQPGYFGYGYPTYVPAPSQPYDPSGQSWAPQS